MFLIRNYKMYFAHDFFYYRFTEDGLLVEGLFWRDVEKLVDDYERALMKTDNA